MTNSRHFLLAAASSAVLFGAGQALAAPPTVEIVAMPHPPVKMALASLREWFAAQGGKLRVKEIDSESTEGAKRMQALAASGPPPMCRRS
jgi:hypothetical protein